MGTFRTARFRRRVSFIPQMEAVECGAACLAMVLAAHGRHVPLVELRQACGVSRDGANAFNLREAARAQGLAAEAIRAEPEHLGELPLPAILHWDFSHFLVLERLTRHGAVVVDPALGRQRVSRAELHHRFTGVALVFAPTEAFQRRPRRRLSLGRYREVWREARPALAQLLGASLMLQGIGLAFPVASQLLIDQVLGQRREAWLWGLGLGLGLATLAKAAVGLLRSWVVQGLQSRMDLHLMGRFMEHLLHLPLHFFLLRPPGDLAHRVQSNTQIRALFTSSSVSALLDAFLLLGYAILMLAYDLRLGALVLAFGGLRLLLLLGLRGRSQQFMTAELAAGGREGSALVNALSALETLKAARAEAAMAQRWADRQAERINAGLGRRRLELVSDQAAALLQGLAGVGILWMGGRLVLSEQLSVGVYAAFITLQALFLGPLDAFLGALAQLNYMGSHLARLDDVLETPREACGAWVPERLQGALELEGVSFAYGPTGPPILKDISLKIRPGEKVAIVGPTGAGKSTLARLMLGLHLPATGTLRFDGHDLRELDLHRVRNQMGVVLQDAFLFDDTIRHNLSLNDPSLPESRLLWAAKMACILDTLQALPLGLDSRVGEQGNLLSGGQRQRLALARALAHDPAILLLDEATSALDLETEARLHANLATLGCTRILIAHRLATVRDADRILVMEAGSLVQSGTYAELEAAPGPFRELVEAMEAVHG